MEFQAICSYCGRTFAARSHKAKYCSAKCKDIVYRTRQEIPVNQNTEPYHKVCVVCGAAFDTFRDNVITCSTECSKKRKNRVPRGKNKPTHSWDEWVAIQKAEAENRQIIKAKEKKQYKKEHTVDRICEICGGHFSCLDTETRKTCSSECSKELKRERRCRKDKRIPKDRRIDNISLKRLYERDKGACYICGGKCDWKDWRLSDNGNLYPGDKYPTVEHVIPVSLGGADAWDNVRLAHWKCNLKKGATVGDLQLMLGDFAKPIPKTGAKKTAQYSLDGELIKIWDSTAAIRRELGLNDTYIQNVCRRSGSNTGNAYGFHWEYVT